MSHPTYRIETIADMLKVPAERRGAMLHELEQGLLLYELALGDEPDAPAMTAMEWTDDGEMHSHIDDQDGKPILSLRVTKDA